MWGPEEALALELVCKKSEQVDLSSEGSTFVGWSCLGKVCLNNPGLERSGKIMSGESCLENQVWNMSGKIMSGEIRVKILLARTKLWLLYTSDADDE